MAAEPLLLNGAPEFEPGDGSTRRIKDPKRHRQSQSADGSRAIRRPGTIKEHVLFVSGALPPVPPRFIAFGQDSFGKREQLAPAESRPQIGARVASPHSPILLLSTYSLIQGQKKPALRLTRPSPLMEAARRRLCLRRNGADGARARRVCAAERTLAREHRSGIPLRCDGRPGGMTTSCW